MPKLLISILLAVGPAAICGWPDNARGETPPRPQVGTASTQIDIPRKVMGGNAIAKVVAIVSFASTAPVTLKITDPETKVWQIGLPSGSPSVCPGTPMGTLGCTFPQPSNVIAAKCPSSTCRDEVVITPMTTLESGFSRYQIEITLYSNYGQAVSCAETLSVPPAQDAYKIDVTAGGPNIIGVCLESYQLLSPISTVCPTANPASVEPQKGAFIDGQSPPTERCYKERPPVDVMMVLDKSGSMNDPPLGNRACAPGGQPLTKIAALRLAVSDFASVWNDLRVNERPTSLSDKIGADLFSSSASAWTPGSMVSGLNQFAAANPTPAFPVPDITGNVSSITANGSTSIGDGLFMAAGQQPAPQAGRREVILLMSDGKQNFGRGVGTDPATNKTATYPDVNSTACQGTNVCTDLAVPVYTVTVGTQTAVDPAIMQAIAKQSGSQFYINTEDNACLLRPFFLEMLQNFLKLNSYETLRMISATAPYTGKLPVATTSRDIEFNLMWQAEFGRLRLTVLPPGGIAPIVKEGGSGLISIVQSLPISGSFNPLEDWKFQVEVLGGIDATATTGSVPFDLQVMADDGAIKSDLSAVLQDYKVGDKILIRAKLTQFGRPILGLGSHPGDIIAAELVEPGQSIGDMLSDSTASPNPPAGNADLQMGAEAKLFNTLQNDPSKLIRRKAPQIKLFDDGKPEHGDDVAGDGIYSAAVDAPLPGNYNVLITTEGVDPAFVRFSRQQLRTIYVRATPDASNTRFASSVFGSGRDRTLSIVMTPRFKPGPACRKKDPKCGRMGAGWANYFWFTAPGVTPFKAVDNLNGNYTATLPFTGNAPPNVQVHFEDVVALIGDSVPPDHLPQPLGPGNVLSPVPPPNQLAGKIALFLDFGAGIPHGTFSSAFNTGFSLNAGLEYIATSHFSAEGIFGYHRFPAKIGSALDLYQFSANGKFYLTSSGPFRPFVSGGIGGYKFSGNSTYFGGNFGGGILYELGPHWGLQGSYNFHAVNSPGAATKFSTVQSGIRFVF